MTIKVIQKPWGHEEIWAHTDQYVGKLLFIRKNCRLSLQHHQVKEEHMRLQTGEVIVFLENENGKLEEHHLFPKDAIHIPPNRKHRVLAIEDSEIIEVSTTEIDDIIRHDDDYGRVSTLDKAKENGHDDPKP